MADTIKKYVSLENLGLYDDKIKALIDSKDADILASANAYADGLADNYEAAGTVASAQEELQGKIDTVSAANVATQAEVDALETLVGTLPSGTSATTVVGYVDAKTAGIATDAALTELNNQFTALKEDVQTIESDYLKDSDKTELRGSIEAVDNAVSAISADYLKSTDKTELEGKINLKADQTALDAEVSARETAVSGLQTQINTIVNNPDTEGVINSINEFTQYITEHGEIADGFRTDINKNKGDISAMDTAYKAADTALSGRLDDLEAIDHNAYVAADTALKNELTTEIGKKADASALTSAVQALEGVDTGLDNRLKAVEASVGESGSVATAIGTAKQEAIDVAAADATSKANTAESNAKGHADSLNTAMNERVEALEAIDHEHSNKALLDSYTQTEANLADAVAKKHEHSNLEVLEGVTAAKVSAWDASEQNAKDYAKNYADGLNTAMDARMVAVEAWQTNMIECTTAEIEALFSA